MGKVLSLFRKERSTVEILTEKEEEIKYLENYTLSTRERHRKFAGRFLVASIGTYVVAFIIFYLYFFPSTWKDRLLYSTPMLLFPIVIITLKYCVSYYFETKIQRNNRKLIRLKNEKKQILEDVMNKERYKVALEILNTFGDNSMKPKPSHFDLDSSNASSIKSNSPIKVQARTPIHAANQSMAAIQRSVGVSSSYGDGGHTSTPVNQRRSTGNIYTPQYSRHVATGMSALQPKATPFPIIDKSRQNVMEKMLDFIISDGPSNRFAMICAQCFGHNGMALQEEFEYVTFKCAFCGFLNPARKQRPIARGLSPASKSLAMNTSFDRKDSDTSDDDDDDDGGGGHGDAAVGQAIRNIATGDISKKTTPEKDSDDAGAGGKEEQNQEAAAADAVETKDLNEKKCE